jgi:hypothetical protein
METLASILKRVLGNDYRINDAVRLEKLKNSWPQVADNRLKLQPCAYKNKVLFLAAEDSARAHDALFFKQVIIDKYKVLNPNITIKDVRIQGTGYKPAAAARQEETAGEPPPEISGRAERLIYKARQLAQNDRRRACPVCGERFDGTGAVCIRCVNIKNEREEKTVLDNLAEAPWAKYEEFNLPSISLERFNRIKRDLRARTLDALRQIYLDYYGQRLPPEQRAHAQKLAVKYVLLKTGLTPGEIDDNIISGQLSRKLYRFIYN